MSKHVKLLHTILGGRSDANVRFDDLVQLLLRLGFKERIRGDHHIFTRAGVDDIINLQPKNTMAKPYQVKQVRKIITGHRLEAHDDE